MVEVENKVQRYERYKDSGVEWLGEIPEHWDLTRLGTRFKERKTKVSDKDFPPLSVTKNGTVPQLANAAKSNDGDNRKLVKKGDFAINSRSDRKGSSGIAYQDGSVSLIYIVMEPLNIHPIYCNYLLKSYNFIEEFYRMGHGIVADLWTTRYDEMKAIMVGIPPLSEQTKIAQFLDDKTTKIDDAIAIKEQQINLLKERKQILIHKAVTRGLDDSVILKDSGVEWLEKVPLHWQMKRLKYVVEIVKRIAGREGFDVLSITQKGIKVKDIESGEGQLAMNYSKYQFAYKGDFAMNHMDLLTGYVDISKYDGVISPDYRVFQNIYKDLDDKYLLNIFQLGYKARLFYRYGRGVSFLGRWRFPSDSFNNFSIPIPPLSEQKEISAYIESASRKIETAIGLKQQEIAKLKEYKSSLINGVVTGKVKVC
ncbi:restriction endonuclease subunit S [Polaribacter sp. AHE13PA]|uniref:restriction endonuclease subunit S n=1 Tax=Polaribacter sp. AHE13PA TaxID=2745562 RepID=UPI001C4FC254|nr:restriction endonuclease subunit S [Polaribacter sp. AHE13PA]QXP65789.1 restriction endonuclease subunit S [Polaribacter sp. AHE13PA]